MLCCCCISVCKKRERQQQPAKGVSRPHPAPQKCLYLLAFWIGLLVVFVPHCATLQLELWVYNGANTKPMNFCLCGFILGEDLWRLLHLMPGTKYEGEIGESRPCPFFWSESMSNFLKSSCPIFWGDFARHEVSCISQLCMFMFDTVHWLHE